MAVPGMRVFFRNFDWNDVMVTKKAALKAAFPHTIPVMTGFLFLGAAFGILMHSKGYHAGWSLLFGLIAYAGSAQYMALAFLTAPFEPLLALGMALMVNARHIFYGLSMLERYRGAGALKPYLIFGMCDETFSLVCSVEPPEGVDRHLFAFFITLLNQSYWLAGSFAGGLLGGLINFNTLGLDYALTALFVVIFIGQWITTRDRRPALIGLGCTAICLSVFGGSKFLLPSMATILAALALLKRADKAAGGDFS